MLDNTASDISQNFRESAREILKVAGIMVAATALGSAVFHYQFGHEMAVSFYEGALAGLISSGLFVMARPMREFLNWVYERPQP